MWTEDHQLCDDVFGLATDDRPDGFPVSDYPTAEQTVVLVWHFTGVIENAGFAGLFGREIPGDRDYRLLRDAFARIDCELARTAIENAFAAFPNGEPPIDVEERRRIWEELDSEEEHQLKKMFFRVSNDLIPEALAKYIRQMQEVGELPKPSAT